MAKKPAPAPAPIIEAKVVEAPAAAPTPAPVAEPVAAAPIPVAAPAAAAPAPAAAPAATAAAPAAFAELSKALEAPLASLGDVQTKVRSLLENGISETRANYSKAKSAADQAANAIEASLSTAKHGVVEISVKALESLRATADANFDFAKAAIHVKSPSEFVTLHGEFARKQIELLTAQTKLIGELAQKVVTESVEPLKAQVEKTFKKVG